MRKTNQHPTGESRSAAPYEALARFYDQLMTHVDYKAWAKYIIDCLAMFGNHVQTLLDAGCGTGSLMRELKTRGFNVSGYDLSFGMLQSARDKGLNQIWQADMLQSGLKCAWDNIICLYDTIHYIEPGSVPIFFREIYNALSPNGLFIFDAVTELHVKTYWANYTEQDEANGYAYVRRSWYDFKKRCQHTEFKITDSASSSIFYEHHHQWIYPISFFLEQAAVCGFFVHGPFNECTLESGNEKSERVHFILCRRAV